MDTISPTQLDLTLEKLKKNGCNIAIVGDTPTITRQQLIQNLFGHPHEERTRVLVANRDSASSADEWLPGETTHREERCKLIQYSLSSYTGSRSNPEDTQFEQLINRVETELTEFASGEPDTLAGRFRFGMVHTSPLIHGLDSDPFTDGFDALTTTITDQSFMGFYSLPLPLQSDRFQSIKQNFDILVEVRSPATTTEQVQQRWEIPNYGKTPWFQL